MATGSLNQNGLRFATRSGAGSLPAGAFTLWLLGKGGARMASRTILECTLSGGNITRFEYPAGTANVLLRRPNPGGFSDISTTIDTATYQSWLIWAFTGDGSSGSVQARVIDFVTGTVLYSGSVTLSTGAAIVTVASLSISSDVPETFYAASAAIHSAQLSDTDIWSAAKSEETVPGLSEWSRTRAVDDASFVADISGNGRNWTAGGSAGTAAPSETPPYPGNEISVGDIEEETELTAEELAGVGRTVGALADGPALVVEVAAGASLAVGTLVEATVPGQEGASGASITVGAIVAQTEPVDESMAGLGRATGGLVDAASPAVESISGAAVLPTVGSIEERTALALELVGGLGRTVGALVEATVPVREIIAGPSRHRRATTAVSARARVARLGATASHPQLGARAR